MDIGRDVDMDRDVDKDRDVDMVHMDRDVE